MLKTNLKTALFRLAGSPNLPWLKHFREFSFWKQCQRRHGTLGNSDYVRFYTTHFGLQGSFYEGKRVLDIGCGPQGSLEWADMAAERVGLDPLADKYRRLGTSRHRMKYVSGLAESIPFPDEYFDAVCSFNSLNHVDDLAVAISEILRVLKCEGLFLFLSDVNCDPTVAEPICYSWDIVERFAPTLEVLAQHHYERRVDGMYQSIDQGLLYDHRNPVKRQGVISAMFRKVRGDLSKQA